MTAPTPRSRRPARYSRWAASGLTAAVAVGSVGAMAKVGDTEVADDQGIAFGAAARYQADVALAGMLGSADPGDQTTIPSPPRAGRAGVS